MCVGRSETVLCVSAGRRVRLRQTSPSLLGSDWWLAWDIEDELELMLVVLVEVSCKPQQGLPAMLSFRHLPNEAS